MLSSTSEYALRAIVYLSEHMDAPHTTVQIAKETEVPVGYLGKIMQGLAKSGLVTSQRGLHGGFVLAKDPQSLTVFDVVQLVDPKLRAERTRTALVPAEEGPRRMGSVSRTLDQARGMAEALYRQTTISSLREAPRMAQAGA